MSTHPQHDSAISDDDSVADYLRAHPNFFTQHAALLADLTLPHNPGNATSLVERQVSILRDQNRRIRQELRELVHIARDNENLSNRIHRLTLALMDAAGLDDALATLKQALCEDFHADRVTVHLFAKPKKGALASAIESLDASFIEQHDPRLAALQPVFERGQPLCGRLTPEQLAYLGGAMDGLASFALIPLNANGCFGLVTIGSSTEDRFQPGMGTVFLVQLSEILSRVLKGYLRLEPAV
jgi:uncharacterized protein YigA (DUF484 family)